jgi:zinc/manganese transport system permease protein
VSATSYPFSWNLAADLRDMWSLPFMVNAFRAGSLVAVLAGLVGFVTVLRRQTFAGHTLAVVGFPGAAAATLLGVGLAYGYFGLCIVAAALIAVRGSRREEPAVIATVQAFGLAAGMLFVSLYGGFLSGTGALLFGSFLAITSQQVLLLCVVGGAALGVLVVIGRPLLFGSLDPAVASARRVPVRGLDAGFLVLLGVTAAATSQVTGSLLVFALLVLPSATAQLLSARLWLGFSLSVAFGLLAVWCALFLSFYTGYPAGFWLTTVGFGGYVLARVLR